MRYLFLIAIVCFSSLLSSCADESDRLTQEVNVYLRVFEEVGAEESRVLLISQHSIPSIKHFEGLERLKGGLEETRVNFREVNSTSSIVPLETGVWKNIVIFPDIERREIFTDLKFLSDSWVELKKKYSGAGGFVSVSRVGFDSELNEAVVYIQVNCGSLCGSGNMLYLKRDSSGWKVEETKNIWVS